MVDIMPCLDRYLVFLSRVEESPKDGWGRKKIRDDIADMVSGHISHVRRGKADRFAHRVRRERKLIHLIIIAVLAGAKGSAALLRAEALATIDTPRATDQFLPHAFYYILPP